MSRHSSGQNSLIFSNKYCCRSRDRPGGGITGSRSFCLQFHSSSCIILIVFSGLSTLSLTDVPRFCVSKWCTAFVPFSARCRKGWSKNSAQSYVGTKTRPSWVPTSCAWFATADFTTRTMSSRHPIFILWYTCLKRLKHQSGENFMSYD